MPKILLRFGLEAVNVVSDLPNNLWERYGDGRDAPVGHSWAVSSHVLARECVARESNLLWRVVWRFSSGSESGGHGIRGGCFRAAHGSHGTLRRVSREPQA